MRFSIQYLSFFVIQADSTEQDPTKRYKHYQTLDHFAYEDSEISEFLDSEFTRIGKRKAEVNANTENAPTKIGRFLVEPGYELDTNPNYNLFQKLRTAKDKSQFHYACDDVLRTYMDTSSVRGGAFIVALAKLNELFDDPFVFLLKCDFESKIARIADEKSLISRVEMAISARNIKSIQYPHMPEEGMLEPCELKIHQASHARYFEDFLKYVSYEKSKPEIVTDQVLGLVQQYMETKWQGGDAYGQASVAVSAAAEEQAAREQAANALAELLDDPLTAEQPIPAEEWTPVNRHNEATPGWQMNRQREESQLEVWAAADKRQLQEKWTHDDVVQATTHLLEHQPELDLKFKLDDVTIKAKMAEYGENIHIARMNGRYIVLIEGDSFQFDKGISPIELLHPDEIESVLERMHYKHTAGRMQKERYE
ncbi:DUF3900 domain-containing protein [Cohnella fermenti]|uniref:DUF3900 domain-containing protein n=1 Tax=Cohnella fermenti TaxID=2565925 RepID=A0A4S4C874_9BACL|nr:DUF3900 domain-containing protein [Cohnella fermenti]THF84154.1 DUF3900 domain-containing protein [Cohnella fermenti]